MSLNASNRRHLALTAAAALFVAAVPASAQFGGNISEADLPPNARVGECYARVYIPPTFVTETDEVLKKEASERVEILPAQYDTVREEVMVKPARMRLVEVPAKYDWAEETIQTSPASTEWKKGPCDPKRQLANATGECLCLVETPARYRTVKRKVMIEPPRTREVPIPAEYKTITKTVEIRPAQERRIPIPAEYTTVTRTVKVSDARMKWQIIDCKYGGPLVDRETAITLQRKLKEKGHDPGPIDGVFGPLTRGALQKFQTANGIPHEGVGERTKKALGFPSGI